MTETIETPMSAEDTHEPSAENVDLKKLSQHDIAAIAYASVAEIPALEMNDRNRLGFHIYLYLIGEIETVASAVHESHARLGISHAEAADAIRAALGSRNIAVV